MKLLVDMNLSPSWVGRLARHGFEAVHFSINVYRVCQPGLPARLLEPEIRAMGEDTAGRRARGGAWGSRNECYVTSTPR